MKITFELSFDHCLKNILNQGIKDDHQAEIMAMGMQRNSRFKQEVKKSKMFSMLSNYQNNGYIIIDIDE